MNTPHFLLEQSLYHRGCSYVAGVDEVGRGSWAGPIVAASVILPKNFHTLKCKLKDSKLLSPKQREMLYIIITNHAVSFSIAMIDNTTIDKKGISYANKLVFKHSIKKLDTQPDYVLFDNFKGKFSFHIPFQLVREGDSTVSSIAAASIIAKVTRDRMMKKFSKSYPMYHFDKHKGYGTSLHKSTLIAYGPCKIHRFSYQPIKCLCPIK